MTEYKTSINDIVTVTKDTAPTVQQSYVITATSAIAYDPLADIKKRLDKLENRFEFVDVTKK